MASSSSASGQTGPSAGGASSRWQDALTAACQERKLRPPTWQMYSDRRGGRTAWTCAVTVGSESIQARFWYDGSFVNNAKEDAAELALQRLQRPTASSPTQQQQAPPQGPASGGQQQPGAGQGTQTGQQGWY